MKFVMLPPQTEAYRRWAARIAAERPEFEVTLAEDEAQARAALQTADAAFGTLTPALLPHARRLKWLQAPMAGPPAGYYYPELAAHPVTVTNFREIFNDHIGAHVMAYVLAFARAFHLYWPQQTRREWRRADRVLHLPESTMLIAGLGGVGQETARMAAAFGMKVLACDARRDDRPEGVAELHPAEALDALLPGADFVVLTVPHTPATDRYFDRDKFARMKPGSFFINIGRGATVVLDDLVEAMSSGRVAGAGLDVFEQEPLPEDHPLWTLPGAIVTPHAAFQGPYLDERRLEIVLDNAARFVRGEPLRNVVDKANWF